MTREDIAACLESVPGLTASATTPATIQPGMAWPVWASSAPINMTADTAYTEVWAVLVALPSDVAGAVEGAHPLVMGVTTALQTGCGIRVRLVEAVTLQVTREGPATLPGLRFTLAANQS